MFNEINTIRALPLRSVQETGLTATAAAQVESSSAASASAPTSSPEVSRQEVRYAIERLNEQLMKMNYSLNFSVDQTSRQVVVKLRDASGQVIRQIPNETVLRLASQPDGAKGLLQDEKI